jgi:hypothetical protein
VKSRETSERSKEVKLEVDELELKGVEVKLRGHVLELIESPELYRRPSLGLRLFSKLPLYT